MSSKRAIRRKACKGKQRHETREAAYAHRAHHARRYGENPTSLNVYGCQFCGGFHIGHNGRNR